jgi:hypothetical protein
VIKTSERREREREYISHAKQCVLLGVEEVECTLPGLVDDLLHVLVHERRRFFAERLPNVELRTCSLLDSVGAASH